jgi:hypothetical protein
MIALARWFVRETAPDYGTEEPPPDEGGEAEDILRLLAMYAARCPGRVREVLAAKPHRCAACRGEFPAGTVFWTSTRPFKGGRRWWTDYVCPFCPTPYPPASTVSRVRLLRAIERNAPRGRGRPAVRLAESERAIVAELRAAGLGEIRVAREFLARTGRRVSARCLARFGRAAR